MSDPQLVLFGDPSRVTGVALPFDLREMLEDWKKLQRAMTRRMPDAFRRDEWAYLTASAGTSQVIELFTDTFGPRLEPPDASRLAAVARPRGVVAVWLPGNVSLLGPLITMKLLMSGNDLLLKATARATDLTGAFLEFIATAIPDTVLARHARTVVTHDVFSRESPQNREWASRADVRIVFGSDAAAQGVDALPHPVESTAIHFIDRRSEAWIDADTSDEVLIALLRVFAIYGQAGCTSPSRVVVLGDDPAAAVRIRDRLLALWPGVLKADQPPAIASSSVLAWQWCLANGWDAVRTPRNSAVLAVVPYGAQVRPSPMLLPISSAAFETAVAGLPENIQTLGVATTARQDRWTSLAARTRIKRIVPVAEMHHFGSVWDTHRYFAECFATVEIGR